MVPIRWRRISFVCTALAAVIALSPACRAGQQPSARPRYGEWKLVAESDLILKAQLIVPVEELRASLMSRRYAYVTVRARMVEALKGTVTAPEVQVRYYTEPSPYDPSAQTLSDLNGKEVLLFLLRVDDPYAAGLYFAGFTPKALQASDPAIVKVVRDEVENQRQILTAYRRSKEAAPDLHHQQVRVLISQTLNKQTEWAAFEKLERMSRAAVPSLIRSMDDRRPLPIQEIELVNKSPKAFEGLRHYGPKVVVDAIAALLNQITGDSFGSIYNGGSERERAKTVAGWRIYLHYQLGKRA